MKQSLPKGRIVNGVLHVTRVDGSKFVFSTTQSRRKQMSLTKKDKPSWHFECQCGTFVNYKYKHTMECPDCGLWYFRIAHTGLIFPWEDKNESNETDLRATS